MNGPEWILVAAFLAAAFLYASVGHGGASAYLAVMALAGVAPLLMRPSALVLNAAVSGLALLHFARAGWFSWRLFWPFALLAVPLAFVGGRITLASGHYRLLLGAVLLFAALRLLFWKSSDSAAERRIHPALALPLGALLGLLAGMTGVGGGIFLSPLLVLSRLATAKAAAAVSAAFVLVNSLAGLLALSPASRQFPPQFSWWIGAVLVGGAAGSWLGSRRFHVPLLLRLLSLVLALAAAKLLLTAK